MSLSDVPMPLLVALFLAVFVLIGIHPALQRSAARIRKLVHSAAQPQNLVSTFPGDVHADLFAEHSTSQPLNDFEIIVLQRFSQAGDKALSRKQVNAPLLFAPQTLNNALKSLHRRGMIDIRVSSLLGQRFTLSATGRRYAVEQGYLLIIEERKGPLG